MYRQKTKKHLGLVYRVLVASILQKVQMSALTAYLDSIPMSNQINASLALMVFMQWKEHQNAKNVMQEQSQTQLHQYAQFAMLVIIRVQEAMSA